MKIFPILGAVSAGMLMVSCSDIASTGHQGVSEKVPMKPIPQKSDFPFSKTITDVQGRAIDVQMLGKSATEVAFKKDNHLFVVPIEKISQGDRDYLSAKTFVGDFAEFKEKILKQEQLKGRQARWHMDLEVARREAAKVGLPILLTVLINGDTSSEQLEKELLFSKEFRDYAKTNLVLSALRVDDPGSNRTSGFDAVKNRNVAASQGVINYTGPVAMLLDNKGRQIFVEAASLGGGEAAISAVESALSRGRWTDVVAMEAPEKQRARTNGGATISGGT